jgi:hypothetical protein
MKLSFVLAVASVTLMVACTGNSRKQEITRLVKAWQGKEIVFPDGMVFTRLASDTVPFDVPKDSWKVLVYLDSSGCSSCRQPLHEWKHFIDSVNTVANGTVPFLFVFHPKTLKGLQTYLKREHFDMPICADLNDTLNRINKFPTASMFQTFLLDSSNRVNIIGDPIHNTSIYNLYINHLKETAKSSNSSAIDADFPPFVRRLRPAGSPSLPSGSAMTHVHPYLWGCQTEPSNVPPYSVRGRRLQFITPAQPKRPVDTCLMHRQWLKPARNCADSR